MAVLDSVGGYTSAGWYLHTGVVELISQDKVANTSTLKITYYVDSQVSYANGSWTLLNDVTFAASIAGSIQAQTPNFDFRESTRIIPVIHYVTVAHDSDGKKENVEIAISGSTNPGSVYFEAVSFTKYINLPRIARQSSFTVTPDPVIEGGTAAIDITRSNVAFTHNVTWVSGSDSGTIATGVATSTTWTPDPALLTGVNKRTITINVETKNGGTTIGTVVSKDILFKAVPDYPEIGQGTPYDIRLRRVVVEGGKLVPKEAIYYLESTLTETFSGSATLTLTTVNGVYDTNLDEAVILADFYDGAQWLAEDAMIFVMSRTEQDITDLSNVSKYSGMSYVDWLLTKNVVAADRDWVAATPGNVIKTYMDEAQTRGWGTHVTEGFSASKTSVNTNWQNNDALNATKDMPVSQILSGFVDDVLCEYRTRFNYTTGKAVLDLYNPGYGEDWSVLGADPIVNLSLAALNKVADAAPVRRDSAEKLTRVTVRGDEASVTRESAADVNPIFGHLEGTATASGVKDGTRLNQLGDAILSINKTAAVERTFSYDLSSTETPTQLFPYRTFRPGDWILVPGDTGPIRARVAQVSITRNVDGSKATITTGDLIPSGLAATARKIAQAGGGAISGGTLQNPSQLSSAIPAAPINIGTVVDGYWDESGAPKAGVAITWDMVERSLANTPILVDLYEIWSRPEVGTPWTMATISDDITADISNLTINTPLDIKIRARSLAGVFGAFSDVVSIVMPEPDETLAAPSEPDLVVDAIGTVSMAWDGEIAAAPPVNWFSHVQGQISDTEFGAYAPAGQSLQTAGTATVASVGAGTWWFRFMPYDKLGVAGAPSDAVSILVAPVLGDTREPKAPTSLVVTSEGYWNGGQANSRIVAEWDAVTEGIDNGPIDILTYEVWGKLSTDVNWQVLGFTNETEITVEPESPIDADWDIKVLAVATNNVRSAFSDTETVTIEAPAPQMDAPTAPTLDTANGNLFVQWDGFLYDESTETTYSLPAYVTQVDIQVSTDAGDTWSTRGFLLAGERTQTVSSLSVGDEAVVRLVARDVLGNFSDYSDTATIVIEGIDGADLLVNSIEGNRITVGSLEVDAVSPNFGNELAINGNVVITAVQADAAALAAAVEAGDAELAADLAQQRARYNFNSTELMISQEGVPFNIGISASQMEFREGTTVRAYLNAGVFNAPRLATTSLDFTNHIFLDDAAGTVIRRK